MIIDRKYLYDMEYIRSEMELKFTQFKITNPIQDVAEMNDKLSKMNGCITHVYQLHEELEKHKKNQLESDFKNQKLLAEILALKNLMT